MFVQRQVAISFSLGICCTLVSHITLLPEYFFFLFGCGFRVKKVVKFWMLGVFYITTMKVSRHHIERDATTPQETSSPRDGQGVLSHACYRVYEKL